MRTEGSSKTKKSWQHQALSKRETKASRECFVQFLVDHGYEEELPTMKMEIIRLVLPYLKRMDPKWKAVDHKTFSKNNFKAHSSLYEALRAALRKPDQLKEEIKRKREAEQLEP